METLSDLEAIARLGLALLAGAILGLERERADKPAGLRTYMLVCEGAALFMVGSIMLGDQVRASGGEYDPSRIGSTIVQGIGFLAGGVILASGQKVRNLTTAAGIWVTAAIGLLVGAGLYPIALTGTIATIVALVGVKALERRFPGLTGSTTRKAQTAAQPGLAPASITGGATPRPGRLAPHRRASANGSRPLPAAVAAPRRARRRTRPRYSGSAPSPSSG